MHTTPLLASDYEACPCCKASFTTRAPNGNCCHACSKALPGVPPPAVEVVYIRRSSARKAA